MNSVWGLNRDITISRSHRRNRERGVSHGVEHSNDLTDDVVARRDGYLFTIGVGDHIVEHCFTLKESEEGIDGSDVGVPIFVEVDPFERAVGGRVLDEHGVMHDLSLSI